MAAENLADVTSSLIARFGGSGDRLRALVLHRSFPLNGAKLFVVARRGRRGERGQAEVHNLDTAFFGRDA